MKLLFDENLSPQLPRLFPAMFPDSVHVRDCGLKGRSDGEIWDYASQLGLVLVSKDSDFYQRSLLFGHPPKFIWLRLGNCTRQIVVDLLTRHESDIKSFVADPLESVLLLG